jgi:hypothetical protein
MFLKSNAAILQGILSFVMKIFLKRNAATLQGVLCFVMNSFSPKNFKDECSFQ